MLPQHVLFALVAAVSAVPLNINLGAYSPALVVGDGEISLGSSEKASELMQTLASGAATGTGQQGQQREGQQQPGGEQRPQGEQRVAEGEKAEEAKPEEKPEEKPAEDEAAKEGRDLKTLNLRDILGKREAAPESEDRLAAVEEAMAWIKRDLAGFREALGFARDAQKDAPRVELGTGEKGAGVGVIVNAGQNVQANSAANGARPQGEQRPRRKRSEVVAEESETPKMTLVAITEV